MTQLQSAVNNRLFITGTDTEVGKTYFTQLLIHALQEAGHSVMAVKPVAAGGELNEGRLENEDAIQIQQALKQPVNYQSINPFCLAQPVAPHIAAQLENKTLSVEQLKHACNLAQYRTDYLIAEGAGGWLVPLNEAETLADYAQAESFQVILVVGLKLGCINHALLTQQSIAAAGLTLVGWVANHIDPQMLNQADNIQTLEKRLNCPKIAELPYEEKPGNDSRRIESAVKYVRLNALRNLAS